MDLKKKVVLLNILLCLGVLSSIGLTVLFGVLYHDDQVSNQQTDGIVVYFEYAERHNFNNCPNYRDATGFIQTSKDCIFVYVDYSLDVKRDIYNGTWSELISPLSKRIEIQTTYAIGNKIVVFYDARDPSINSHIDSRIAISSRNIAGIAFSVTFIVLMIAIYGICGSKMKTQLEIENRQRLNNLNRIRMQDMTRLRRSSQCSSVRRTVQINLD